jgi:predicted MPP superfamily phosphohydrolase
MDWARRKMGMGHFDPSDFEISHIPLSMKNVPDSFDGYRIVHITDIHLGQWINPERLDGIIELVNNENPDLVVNTGDYFSWSVSDLGPALVKALRNIQSPDGFFTVLGNHDHWVGPLAVRRLLREAAVIELPNDVRTIIRGDDTLIVAGLDDVTVDAAQLETVTEKLSHLPDTATILLVHEPDFADASSKTGKFQLELSGHSHGGQFVLPYIGPLIRGPGFAKYPLGMYHVNGMIQYTNRGLGSNWLWVRMNCPPEIAVFELHPIRDNNG